LAVFLQGCPHNCPGCHNPQTHDPNGGYSVTFGEILEEIKRNPLLDGVTFTGGEPFLQAGKLAALAACIKALGLSIMAYTGYTWEELLESPERSSLLPCLDTLADGRFDLSKKSLELAFTGSTNQRLIDVRKSLASGQVALADGLSRFQPSMLRALRHMRQRAPLHGRGALFCETREFCEPQNGFGICPSKRRML
jgi:anaerobic ribonucleoside-triphosphate reductase activating protein